MPTYDTAKHAFKKQKVFQIWNTSSSFYEFHIPPNYDLFVVSHAPSVAISRIPHFLG